MAGEKPIRVVYVHGVSRQKQETVLRAQWDNAIFGASLGDRSRFAYWSDLRYWDDKPVDLSETEILSDGPTRVRLYARRVRRFEASEPAVVSERLDFEDRIFESQLVDYEKAARELAADKGEAPLAPKWIPGPLERPILSLLAKDASYYLFEAAVRGKIRERLRECLSDPNANYLVIAHSLGSLIAFDELSDRRYADWPKNVTLLTLGSPLGQSDMFDKLREFHPEFGKSEKVARPACVSAWVDFRDSFDPVALSGGAAEYIRDVRSVKVNSSDSWNPFAHHYALNYFQTAEIRTLAGKYVPNSGGPLGRTTLAADVIRKYERERGSRQPVLIELEDVEGVPTLADAADKVERMLFEVVGERQHLAKIDRLSRFVAARLTLREIDELTSMRNRELVKFGRIWSNSTKRANQAAPTKGATPSSVLQVRTAQLGYEADGAGIGWAVLDTGIRPDHPHFAMSGAVKLMADCIDIGTPKIGHPGLIGAALNKQPGIDRQGHGTHVAGLIAGYNPKNPSCDIAMAPRADLYCYKVLDDNGGGDDASIIKALEDIARRNAQAPKPVIHGVNLSLGGPFDSDVYGTGHSPLCREIRRLIQSGVVVCVAAGNEGAMTVLTLDADDTQSFAELQYDVSIGDPANLEDAIAVGSVHSTMPEKYGVSFFSSKGPTADGRVKPDVVAPGEKVLSANALFQAPGHEPYIALSGSSMACPHVSGLIAAFLSVRRGYIGYPERVKAVLMDQCLDLKRDRYFQGAGLPNLVKMLLATA